jgi:23S rRNA (cytidine1920-2'-O)/16S rRNA (cytidine1409-2'-O)-methyltransferase
VDLIVMDVSFISATYIIPQFPELLTKDGYAVCLIKPQFEVGKAMLGKGGIVKDASAHRFAIDRVCDCVRAVGLNPIDLISSPITGGDGNREFLLLIQKNQVDTATLTDARIRAVLNGAGS